ncbi:MAG: hypothetical protein FJ110_05210 [Deltaproteobacteria bacterium]|nr:hypothetical protein [Deltaproteobacteria bacterium]
MAFRRTGGRDIFIMKRTTILTIYCSIFFLFFASTAFGQVQTRFRVIRASNVGTGVDPSLGDIHGQLGSLFSFTSYRLLKDEILHLSPNRPASISAWEGRIIIETTLERMRRRDVADLRIRVARERINILNTNVRLSPGRTVLIGGPKIREGVIIYAISSNF